MADLVVEIHLLTDSDAPQFGLGRRVELPPRSR